MPFDLNLDGEYTRRVDDQLSANDTYQNYSKAYTIASEASWRPSNLGSAQLRYSHREKDYKSADSSAIVNDVGRLEALISLSDRFA